MMKTYQKHTKKFANIYQKHDTKMPENKLKT